MRHKACDSGGIFALLLLVRRHIGLLFGNRLDTNLLCHRMPKHSDSPVRTLSDSLKIFPTLESGFKMSGSAVEFAGYVWSRPVVVVVVAPVAVLRHLCMPLK